jgi:hypothetical protein
MFFVLSEELSKALAGLVKAEGKRTVGGGQWSVDSGRWAVGGRRWAVVGGQ